MVVSIEGLQHEAASYPSDIAVGPPNLEHFYFLKRQVAGIAAHLRASNVPSHCHFGFNDSCLVKSDIELPKIHWNP